MAQKKPQNKPKPKAKPRKKKKSNSKNNNKKPILYYINKAILFLIIFIIVFFVYTIFIKDDIKEISDEISNKSHNKVIKKHKKTVKELSKEFEEKTKELTIEYVDNDEEQILTNKKPFNIHKEKLFPTEVITPKPIVKDIKPSDIVVKKVKKEDVVNGKEEHTQIPEKIKTPINTHNKPMLAIVIDDVSNKSQVSKITNINYPITMAFLPPTSRHKNSASIAQNIPVHMIHLPLEAGNRKYEEFDTLHVGDSLEKIDARIKYLRKIYPNTLYTNNHTGSKFTSDDISMDRLVRTLKKYNFFFVDSRTTSKTVIKKYARKYNLPYMSRNVFIDNKQDKQYIIKQLKSAIKIAKKKGFAIAIGHPHTITLKTLKEVKYLFRGVDLVSIKTLANNR